MIAATKQEAREIILRGVEKLLALRGYRKMTIDELAAEVGIGKGTIYLYFPSKEELVLSHIDAIVDHVCQSLRALSAGKGRDEDKLYDMLVERVMVRFEAVQPYRKKVGENLSELRPLLLQRRKQHFQQEAEIIAECLLAGRQRGRLHFRNANETALNMVYATNCMLPISLTDDELEDRDYVRSRTSAIAKLLVSGVLSMAASDSRS